MTRFEATAPDDRVALVADAVVAHRKRASEAAVFEAEPPGADDGEAAAEPRRVRYADRVLRLGVAEAERERLDALLDEFPVFKVEQPATRKAEPGVVHVSALADPKHAADFVDRLFIDMYGHPDDYRLWAVRV